MHIYTADYVVTQNNGRDIIEKGAVGIDGATITCVGHADMMRDMYPDAELTELGRAVIMPGLVNAHTHVPMSLYRGFSDDKALMDWLTQDIFPAEAKLTAEMVEMGALFSLAEMVRTGTTSFFDMYMHSDAVFRAADSIGIRGVIGENITRFFPNLAFADMAAYRELMAAQAERCRNHPRLRQAITPHAPYTTSPELLQECRAIADEHGAVFAMHLAETESETETCLKEHGMRPVPYAESLGLLQPDSTFPHLVHVDEHDIELLAENRCAAVHNPASNMKLASGVAPVEKMIRGGVDVALGTDGPASNNAQNMFREMYVATLLHKVDQLSPTACPATLALDMATRGGSAAMHDPLIGVLEPGMRADFIALDLTTPNMQPVYHIVSNIVYAASGLENRLTVVDGRELYRDGKFLTCDYDALCREIKERAAFFA